MIIIIMIIIKQKSQLPSLIFKHTNAMNSIKCLCDFFGTKVQTEKLVLEESINFLGRNNRFSDNSFTQYYGILRHDYVSIFV
jgi:hypothetical protein